MLRVGVMRVCMGGRTECNIVICKYLSVSTQNVDVYGFFVVITKEMRKLS